MRTEVLEFEPDIIRADPFDFVLAEQEKDLYPTREELRAESVKKAAKSAFWLAILGTVGYQIWSSKK